jgi:hypothetical protein
MLTGYAQVIHRLLAGQPVDRPAARRAQGKIALSGPPGVFFKGLESMSGNRRSGGMSRRLAR